MKAIQKIIDILVSEQRKRFFLLLGLMFVGMVLETVGVGLFIPTLALMTEANIEAKYPEISPLLDVIGTRELETLIPLGLFALVGVFLIKNIFLMYLAWAQTRFSTDVQTELSKRLFEQYLREPYAYHLEQNSSILIRNVTSEVEQFSFRALQPLMMLITESMVLVGISCLLLIIEPIGAATLIAVIGVSGYFFQRAIKSNLLLWGKQRQDHEGQRIKHLQQGLGGIKDVKLRGREDTFLNNYQLHNRAAAQYSRREHVLQYVPRYFLETLAVLGFTLLVISMLAQGRTIETLIPVLGLFGAAALRLMPVSTRILASIQRIRFSSSVVDLLQKELRTLNTADTKYPSQSAPLNDQVDIKNVCFEYKQSSAPALEDINLTIKKGKSIGIIGESGAGKSTLVNLILGLLKPSSGTISVDGVDIEKIMSGWQSQIGYVPQSIFLIDDTLRRNIAFGLEDHKIDENKINNAIQLAQLEPYVNSLEDGKDTIFGERGIRLSGGQLQRIGIARALYHDPEIIVLDEATSSLDTGTEKAVMDAVNRLQGTKTIIIVTHRLSTIENCDEVVQIENGRIRR